MEHDNATKRAASSTDPECPVKKQRIKTEVGALPLATGYEVQKTYYKHFVEKWERQQDVSIVSALPQLPQPSQEELGRISYHAELRLDGTKSTPRLWLKKPQLNSYSKRFFDRWGSDRFLFVTIPQRFPDFHGSQLGRFDFLDRSFRFLVPKLQSSYGKDAKDGPTFDPVKVRMSMRCRLSTHFLPTKIHEGHLNALFFLECPQTTHAFE